MKSSQNVTLTQSWICYSIRNSLLFPHFKGRSLGWGGRVGGMEETAIQPECSEWRYAHVSRWQPYFTKISETQRG